MTGQKLPDVLRACARGREEYAETAPNEMTRTVLLTEATALAAAARIADGDLSPAYSLIPSWRWREAGLPDLVLGRTDE